MAQIKNPSERPSLPVAVTDLILRLDQDGTLRELVADNAAHWPTAPASFVGRNLYDLAAFDLAHAVMQRVAQVLQDGVSRSFTHTPVDGGGELVYDVRLTASGPDEVLVICHDVSEQKRVEREVLQVNRALLALQSAATAITASLDLDHILETFLWELAHLLGVEECAALAWHAADDRLTLLASTWQADWPRAARVGDGYALAAYPFTRRVIHERYAQQITGRPATQGLAEFEVMQRVGVKTLLLLPMVFQGQAVGLVEVGTRAARAPFSDHEIALAQLLTNEAASAIANARLYDEAQRRVKEQTALRRASAIISSTLDLESVLHLIAEQMTWAIDATSALIARVDSAESRATVLAEYITPQAHPDETRSRLGDSYHLDNDLGDSTRQPTVWHIDDPDLPAGARRLMQADAAQTVLIMPMKIAGQFSAFAMLRESRRRRAVTPEDINLIQGIAQQAAIAIENARLYDQLDRRLHELATLNQIGQAVTSTLDLQETLTIITDSTRDLMGVDAVTVVLRAEGRDRLLVAAASGNRAAMRGRELAAGHGIAGWVMAHGEPLLVPDVAADPRYDATLDAVTGSRAQAVLCVPLQVHGQTIGAIDVVNKRDGAFDEEDVRLLTSLAVPAATAIENARLYAQARQEIGERQRAEATLEAERASLAQRVAERTAELRRANMELAHAARLKDEFLASMSHELRTPLNAILLIAEGLQEEIYGTLNKQQINSLRVVEESGRHLLALINDILDVSKIEAGQIALEIETVAVQTVCDASLQFIKEPAGHKMISITSTIDGRAPTLQADSRRLKQILINLLSNAVKFTPDGGAIGLEVKGDAAAGQIHFTVWDTGIGIADDDMARLFQPFVQLDSSLSRRYEGTGLGLTLVRRMAELHGGTVAVTSAVGQGSRFTVSLPWREPERRSPNPVQRPARAAGTLRANGHGAGVDGPLILLADDDGTNIEIFGDVLQMMGYRVVVARDGHEAVQRADSERPALILMDIQMPGMDGLEAIRQIRAGVDSAETPIIALTALAMKGDREKCLQAGADDYLSKPVPLHLLQQTIQRHLPA